MTIKNNYLIVFCSCPDEAVAGRLADALVAEGLAACVSQVGGVTSTYRWEGEVRKDPEVLLLIKTTGGRLANLTTRIEDLHPYDVPEIIAVALEGGSERYLAWLGQTVATPA
ncbi:MAG: hypothetical protein H6R27_1472 [Proteobacteria bacterium]|nr:hypothetical protein [Pseudomonadota bacterium]